jgi:hypothetical protein
MQVFAERIQASLLAKALSDEQKIEWLMQMMAEPEFEEWLLGQVEDEVLNGSGHH